MSTARTGTYPLGASYPERAAVVVPRPLALMHAADVDAVCARETLPEALILALRFMHRVRACAITHPTSTTGETSETGRTTRVYYRLGEQAAVGGGISGEAWGHTGQPDHMIALTFDAAQAQQWRTYQHASSVTVRTQLRLALLHECLSTAALSHDLITEHLTRPYADMRHLPRSDICAALTLWWWHHTSNGETREAMRTMLALLMHPTLAAQVRFPNGTSVPVLAPEG